MSPREIHVRQFQMDDSQESLLWNLIVKESRNGTFLLERGYMEYHRDRFTDHSLIVEQNGNPIAIFPAAIHDESLVSHAGLTYGGLIYGREMHAATALHSLASIVDYARAKGLKKIYYKPVPTIYHKMPAQEDLYALFRLGANLVRRDLSSSIDIHFHYTPSKGRKSCIVKANKSKIRIEISHDFNAFMKIQEEILASKHQTKPTHTAEELIFLESKFPDNIELYIATLDSEMLAGIILYKTLTVCHAQYIAVSDHGKKIGAGDALIHHVLEFIAKPARWFDFGISTTQGGYHLDENLATHKESWGARATVYDHYEICL